jgi:hypothetical protein
MLLRDIRNLSVFRKSIYLCHCHITLLVLFHSLIRARTAADNLFRADTILADTIFYDCAISVRSDFYFRGGDRLDSSRSERQTDRQTFRGPSRTPIRRNCALGFRANRSRSSLLNFSTTNERKHTRCNEVSFEDLSSRSEITFSRSGTSDGTLEMSNQTRSCVSTGNGH